jgi:hypothetical protein
VSSLLSAAGAMGRCVPGPVMPPTLDPAVVVAGVPAAAAGVEETPPPAAVAAVENKENLNLG